MVKKVIILVCLLIFNIPSWCNAGFIDTKNPITEFRVGSIGVTDEVNMSQLHDIFGDTLKPIQSLKIDDNKTLLVLVFKDATVFVDEFKRIDTIILYSSKGINGVELSTPRNIGIGSTLEEVKKNYGGKYLKEKSDNGSLYLDYYDPQCIASINFYFDSRTQLVNKIMLSL